MLITSTFVVINLPKSGSSFVRTVLKSIYARRRGGMIGWPWLRAGGGRDRLHELILPNIRLPGRPKDQHGTVAQIPARDRDKAIVSVVRDPHTKMVSEYRFRWWADHPPLNPARLRRLLPSFPDLSFAEFLVLSDHLAAAKVGEAVAARIGNLTIEFVQFFFADPATALGRMSDDYIRSGAFKRDMASVEFLQHEDLNRELASFLGRSGFGADEVASCLAHEPVNVTAGDGADARNLWTASTLARFQGREHFLLAMLEALGFHYPPPHAGQGDMAADGS